MTRSAALTILVVGSIAAVGATLVLVALFALHEVDWYWPVVVGVVSSGWVLQTWREVRAARRRR